MLCCRSCAYSRLPRSCRSEGVFDLAKGIVGSAVQIVNSAIAFLLSNLIPLAVLAAAAFAFIAFSNSGKSKKL